MENRNRKRLIIGIILVIVGSVFLADNLGFDIDFPDYIFAWPAIFLAIALVNLLSGNRRSAIIMAIIGGFFYLQYYGWLDLQTYWPVLLILFGLSFIFRRRVFSKTIVEDSRNSFDEIAIFGGIEKKFTSDALEGGKITSIFGGNNIDLRNAKAKDGAIIDVVCVFGGVELLLPADWNVNIEATAIFGGFSDSRSNIDPNASVHVRIKGVTIFGGGEVKS